MDYALLQYVSEASSVFLITLNSALCFFVELQIFRCVLVPHFIKVLHHFSTYMQTDGPNWISFQKFHQISSVVIDKLITKTCHTRRTSYLKNLEYHHQHDHDHHHHHHWCQHNHRYHHCPHHYNHIQHPQPHYNHIYHKTEVNVS